MVTISLEVSLDRSCFLLIDSYSLCLEACCLGRGVEELIGTEVVVLANRDNGEIHSLSVHVDEHGNPVVAIIDKHIQISILHGL